MIGEVVFKFNANQVRLFDRDGSPWFSAADVCAVLGVKNYRDSLAHLDADEKGVVSTDTLGGKQGISVVNESGLYALVLRSRKPQARKFAKWVTSEVLPSIRKTGSYQVQPVGDLLDADYRKQAKAFASDYYERCRAMLPEGVKPPEWNQSLHVASAQIADGLVAEIFRGARWLMNFDHNYRLQITPVAQDAFVMSLPKLLKAINEPGDINVETSLLAEFAAATIKRIAIRSEHFEQCTRELRHSAKKLQA